MTFSTFRMFGLQRPFRLLRPVALLALVLLITTGLSSEARAQVRTTAVPFLMIEPDSRASGMGNASVALADNVNAIFWNPAGLAFQEGAEISLTHTNWLPEFNTDLYFDYLVGKYQVDGIGTFGGQFAYMNLGEHERRLGPDDDNPSTFSSYEFSGGLSYGRQLGDNFALGTGVRVIYSKLADARPGGESLDPGVTGSFDLAALYRTDPFSLGGVSTTFSSGLNLSNMGPAIQYDEKKDPIPTHLRFGYAFTFEFDEFNQLTFTNDFGKMLVNSETTTVGEDSTVTEVDPFYEAIFSSWQSTEGFNGEDVSALQQITVGTGLEYWYSQLFALRTGYYYEDPNFGDRQFLTFGAGLRYNIVGLDFSYIFPLAENDPLANTIRLSLLIDFARN